MTAVDLLVPTCGRPAALAVTLAGVAAQTHLPARVVVADQTAGPDVFAGGEVRTPVRLLEQRGVEVELHHRPVRRGIAEQRQFLLDRCASPYAHFLDDDLVLDADLVERLARTLDEEGCKVLPVHGHVTPGAARR